MDEKTLDNYRKAGAGAARARDFGASLVKDGASILDAANRIEQKISELGAKMAFPVNISINDTAAHFTPAHEDSALTFRRGDIVKIDVGAHVDGCIGDTASTIECGANDWVRLIQASRDALALAVEGMRPGVNLGSLGGEIEKKINSFGYEPIKNLTGHSMGPYNLHAGLSIPNVRTLTLESVRPGDAVAIEPFATNGAGKVKNGEFGNIYRFVRDRPVHDDGQKKLFGRIKADFGTLPFAERWCAGIVPDTSKALRKLVLMGAIMAYPVLKEARGGVISQAEHTVIITADGCEITTK